MKLYNSSHSPNAKRIRVLANELGITLNVINVDFSKGENKTPEYMAKNPMGKLPTLEDDDGYVIWESPAIMTYLATKNAGANLLPTDARGRAETTRWMFWSASHLESACMDMAMEKMVKPMMGGTPDEARMAHDKAQWERFAPVLNGHLEGKTWLVSNTFSIADIALGT